MSLPHLGSDVLRFSAAGSLLREQLPFVLDRSIRDRDSVKIERLETSSMHGDTRGEFCGRTHDLEIIRNIMEASEPRYSY